MHADSAPLIPTRHVYLAHQSLRFHVHARACYRDEAWPESFDQLLGQCEAVDAERRLMTRSTLRRIGVSFRSIAASPRLTLVNTFGFAALEAQPGIDLDSVAMAS